MRTRRRKRWIVLGVIVGSYLAAALALDVVGGFAGPRGRYDAIVVAGAGVLPSGAPSRPLAARVDLAVQLHRAGVAPRIVMTGGVGEYPPAEAVVAAARARDQGVDPGAIVLEDRSTSTEENAELAARRIGSSARILVVTDRFHVLRARRVFERYFHDVDAVGCVSSPWPRIRGALREVAAVIDYGLRGRL